MSGTVYRDSTSMSNHGVSTFVVPYTVVPKLWNETIEAHRAAVREATLDTAAALVAEHGLRSVTMSQIAEQTGIGRATLYKYFPDVEAFLHRDGQVARAEQQLRDMIQALLTEATTTGDVRDDVAPSELASYCLHALTAAGSLPSKTAVRRLVAVTLAGLRPTR
jgi:hypothetical protein